MSGIDVDDSDPAVVYSGSWQALTGTVSEQFDQTVHTTSTDGDTATIKFNGTRIILYLTVPAGNGFVAINTTLDGNLGSLSRNSQAANTYYQDIWFDSGPIADGVHIFVVTNAGNEPLNLDKFNIEGTPINSTTAPNLTSTTAVASQLTVTTQGTATQSSTGQRSGVSSSDTNTIVSVQYITTVSGVPTTVNTLSTISLVVEPTSADASQSSSSGASSFPIGAIVGIVLGATLLLAILLCLICRRRKRHAAAAHFYLDASTAEGGPITQSPAMRSISTQGRATDVTPFPIDSPYHQSSKASPTESASASSPIYGGISASLPLYGGAAGADVAVSPTVSASPSEQRSARNISPAPSGEIVPLSQHLASLARQAPSRSPEADAGLYHTQYIPSATLSMPRVVGSGMYASTYGPPNVDMLDVPPPYQSAQIGAEAERSATADMAHSMAGSSLRLSSP